MQVHQKTFNELARLPMAQFLEQMKIGFYKHSGPRSRNRIFSISGLVI